MTGRVGGGAEAERGRLRRPLADQLHLPFLVKHLLPALSFAEDCVRTIKTLALISSVVL